MRNRAASRSPHSEPSRQGPPEAGDYRSPPKVGVPSPTVSGFDLVVLFLRIPFEWMSVAATLLEHRQRLVANGLRRIFGRPTCVFTSE